MADFSAFRARRTAFNTGAGVVERMIAIYQGAAGVRDTLVAYQAGTDADLVAAINSAFTNAQRAELATVAQKLATLASDLETNHASLIAGG